MRIVLRKKQIAFPEIHSANGNFLLATPRDRIVDYSEIVKTMRSIKERIARNITRVHRKR
jgi:hypothetical protein